MSARKRRVTLIDVAKRAGVSRQTVSRVLNGDPHVAEETRRRVEEAIRALGYRPNRAARSLARGQTNTIAVVVPYTAEYLFSDPHLLRFIAGVDQEANQRDFVLLVSSAKSPHDLSAYERVAQLGGVDGIIVVETVPTAAGLDLLLQHGHPCVVLGYGLRGADCYCVHADDFGGARLGTLHLLSLGHRRIGVISGPDETVVAIEARLQGVRRTLAEHGYRLPDEYVVAGDFTPESGYEAARRLMSLPAPPTAIFALNDRMAIGAIRYLKEAGYRVPQDVSVIGFDDVPLAELFDPPLTTIRQPALEMGQQAARVLFDLIRGYAPATRTLVLPVDLIVRKSTAPLEERVSPEREESANRGHVGGSEAI